MLDLPELPPWLARAGRAFATGRFAGASAGACVASLLAIGLSAKQLYRELRDTDREAEGLEPGAC